MGWEMLPPEQPVWVSRCCPDECVKERDELRRRCESYKSAYDAILADLKIMEKKLSDLEAERDRLLEVVKLFYRKHVLNDESIGWDELGDKLYNELSEILGDKEFCKWLDTQSM